MCCAVNVPPSNYPLTALAKAAICLKTISVQQCMLSFNIQSYYCIAVFLGCIQTLPTCQTPITLIIESFLSSEQITLTLSVQRRYLLTNSYDIVLLHSLGCIHPIPTYQTLITLIALGTESFFTICTDNVNAICRPTTISSNSYDIVLLYSLGCIQTLPTSQTLITLIMESFGQITLTARWLPSTGIHRFQLAAGISSLSAHSLTESK